MCNNSLAGVHALEDVMEAGLAFVGKNAKKAFNKGGRFEGWESADVLKRFSLQLTNKEHQKTWFGIKQRVQNQIFMLIQIEV